MKIISAGGILEVADMLPGTEPAKLKLCAALSISSTGPQAGDLWSPSNPPEDDLRFSLIESIPPLSPDFQNH